MRFSVITAASAVLVVGLMQPAAAKGPKAAGTVKESVDTTAAPDKVWSVIGDFAGIANWLPGAVSSPATSGNDKGSVRTITLKAPGGPTVVEKLMHYDAAKYSYTYAIEQVDPKVLPVVNYKSTISVKAGKKGTKITWTGHFDPAPGTDLAADEKAVSGLYQSGLGNAKTLSEK